jgi:hypothetical protein
MKLELATKLCKKYPRIFKNQYVGFNHNDGWYNIIDIMCNHIQVHIDWTRKLRLRTLRYNRALNRACSGDYSSYNRLNLSEQRDIDEEISMPEPQLNTVPSACSQVVAVAVNAREKFGTLNFYYSGGDEVISGIVLMAESISSVTCEVCGDAGNISGTGWIRTLCQKHTTS